MKKAIFLCTALLFCALAACTQKKPVVLCHRDIRVNPAYVGFVGFSSHDLDTVHLRTYAQNGRYDTLLRDTAYGFAASMVNDTARHADGSIAFLENLKAEWSYEVMLPAIGRTYRISGFYYNSGHGYNFYTDDCPAGGVGYTGADSSTVDGIPATLGSAYNFTVTTLYLRK